MMFKSLFIACVMILNAWQQPASQNQQRATDPTDPMPPPNLDYFVGEWNFEWNVPESPLGPAGKLKGKETYKKINASTWESQISGDGPSGVLQGKSTTTFDEKAKQVARTEAGFFGKLNFKKSGPIGGDLGGYFTIHWQTDPVKKDGKTIVLKGKTLMLSPAHYRMQVQISVDGGPFTNFGNPWFRKANLP